MARRLSSSQWNVSQNDPSHFQTWSIKPPIHSWASILSPLPAKWELPRPRGWRWRWKETGFLSYCTEGNLMNTLSESYLRRYLSINTLLSHWCLGVVCYTSLLCLIRRHDQVRIFRSSSLQCEKLRKQRVGHREIKNIRGKEKWMHSRGNCKDDETLKEGKWRKETSNKYSHFQTKSLSSTYSYHKTEGEKIWRARKENEEFNLGPIWSETHRCNPLGSWIYSLEHSKFGVQVDLEVINI